MRNAAVLALREGDPSARCVQERRATTCTKTPLSMLAVDSTQPFPSMSMPVMTSQAHFQSNTYHTKKAQTNTWYFLTLFLHFFLLQNADFAPIFLSLLREYFMCCKPKVLSQTWGWDTMEPKCLLSFLPSMHNSRHFCKNTLQILQFLGDYSYYYYYMSANSKHCKVLYANSKHCISLHAAYTSIQLYIIIICIHTY